jgi:hypothetical protein
MINQRKEKMIKKLMMLCVAAMAAMLAWAAGFD